MNFLFGWITKNQFQLTILDSFIAVIEIIGILFISCVLYVWIKEKIEHKRKRKEK